MEGGFPKYSRQISLEGFGEAGQARLKGSRMVLVGAGGVGSAALPLLAGAGVGSISIADFDTISESNLHRQTIYAASDCGKPKAELAASFAGNLNPDIAAVPFKTLIDGPDDLIPLLEGAALCIDATDSFKARFTVSDACEAAGVRLVGASAAGWVSQLACMGEGFWMRDLLGDENAKFEGSSGLPIFGPAAALSGVWAAGLALRVAAGLEPFVPGSFRRFSFADGRHFNALLKRQTTI